MIIECVMRVKGGAEIASFEYDGDKYLDKVLGHFKRSRVLPKQVPNPNDPEGEPIPNPVTPGKAVGLRIMSMFDQIALAEEKARVEDAFKTENTRTIIQQADLVDIKVDLEAL